MKKAPLSKKQFNKRQRARLVRYKAYLAGASLLLSGTAMGADPALAEPTDAAAAPKTNSVPWSRRFAAWMSGGQQYAGSTQPEGANSAIDVFETPLEDLMKIKVTSVSKKEEKLSDAASAIYVITQDDIRRSGVTSIPEALRLSPGLEVARQDAHTWAISSRGFNDEFANQLLVLIDGRSVYTPLFAGVYWDVQDLLLEDIDRIEVIRGPGATLWGANAVNGVINITTKTAKETQGTLLTGGVGSEELGFGARYGAQLHDNGYLRVYGKWFDRDASVVPSGERANDAWTMQRGGFRYDFLPDVHNTFTLQGDIYSGTLDQSVTQAMLPPVYAVQNNDDVDVSGADVLGKWVHTFENGSELALKIYYDRTWRDRVVFAETRNTFDIDLQHRFHLGHRNDIVWGLGYNMTADHLENTYIQPGLPWVAFNPSERTAHLFSGFVQDEITLIEDTDAEDSNNPKVAKLRLTLGTKIEHNDYTGWEVQPSARLSYSITKKQTAWLSASRAISTPSRAEHNITINQAVVPAGIPTPAGTFPFDTLLSLQGSPAMVSKELIGFELGYRWQAHDRVGIDIATFYNLYDKQRSLEAGAPDFVTAAPTVIAPFTIGNAINGETYGFEVSSTIQLVEPEPSTRASSFAWRVRANYSFLKINLHVDEGKTDFVGLERAEKDSPVNQVGIRSLMDLPLGFELDGGMRYVDALSNRGVDSYVVGDVRLGWRSPKRHWEISVTGQNLFDTHKEFAPSYIPTQVTEVETSVFAKVTFRY